MKNVLISQFLRLCANDDFFIIDAEKLIKQMNINEPFIYTYGEKTTFLSVAVEEENIKMVELLLRNGADVNLICNGENVFWNLQYTAYPEEEYAESEIADKSDEMRLRIAQLLLDYGANPNIILGGETLFFYVCFKISEDPMDRSLKYLIRYFILLVAYGGASEYYKPNRKKEFDKSKLNLYKFYYEKALEGKHLTGVIVDENGEVVAEI